MHHGRDNLRNGYIDRVLQEPSLGARPNHYDFFRELRRELIQSTNEAVSEVKSMKLFRAMAIRASRNDDAESIFMRWNLSSSALSRLVELRQRKYRAMSRHARLDGTGLVKRAVAGAKGAVDAAHSFFRYDVLGKQKKRLDAMFEEIGAEAHLVRHKLLMPFKRSMDKLLSGTVSEQERKELQVHEQLTRLSCPEDGACLSGSEWAWISPRSQEDKTISCPNVRTHHCPDLWAPDLFGDFAGVCPNCGHHFPMEYRWYLENVFSYRESREFNQQIESVNPLHYEQFDLKLDKAKDSTGLKSACITFETAIEGVDAVVAVLCAPFRGGSVGAAEGEKFIRRRSGPGASASRSSPTCTARRASASRRGSTALSRCRAAPLRSGATSTRAASTSCSTTPIPMPGRWRASWAVLRTSSRSSPPTSASPDPAS